MRDDSILQKFEIFAVGAAQRRLQTIGFAAGGIAAAAWLSAAIWLWPMIR